MKAIKKFTAASQPHILPSTSADQSSDGTDGETRRDDGHDESLLPLSDLPL